MSAPQNVTALLVDWSDGDRESFDRLFPVVYGDLERIARRHLLKERQDHTLNTQALVHESYLNLVDGAQVRWKDRSHFYAMASRAMRHILIDHARRKRALKRGGDQVAVTLGDSAGAEATTLDRILALDEALSALEERDERLARVVECKFFAGLKSQEAADALGISLRTVERDWRRARAYLRQALKD